MGLWIIGFYVAVLFGLLSSAFYSLHLFSSTYSVMLAIETGTDMSSQCLAFPHDCFSTEDLPPNTDSRGDLCLCDSRDLTLWSDTAHANNEQQIPRSAKTWIELTSRGAWKKPFMESAPKSLIFLQSTCCGGMEIAQFTWDHAVCWMCLLLLLGISNNFPNAVLMIQSQQMWL